jgi:Domain of Unknown Function (DUF1080)
MCKCVTGRSGSSIALFTAAAVSLLSAGIITAQPKKDDATAQPPAQPAKEVHSPKTPPGKPGDAGSHTAANTLTEQEKKDGWTLLFDGTTAQFRGYKADKLPSNWVAKDGTLHLTSGGGGDIVTLDQYTDFEFACEWKISDGGNSGIMYRVAEIAGATYETGPEFQVLDNLKHRDADPKHTAGALYGLYVASKDMTRPAGEWNSARIVVKGSKVEHWWNGEKVVEADLASDECRKLIAGSKFDAWKGFAVQPKGHIALQDHGDKVWYRNLKIRASK